MDAPEASIHSFIVKIWLEETATEAGKNIWRGHITHVPSGKRRYIQHMDEITAFIALYLEEMGIKPDIWWLLWKWLSQWKRWKARD